MGAAWKAISGLDGARRQEVANDLWAAWRDNGRGAVLLTGFSGLGKTEQVVRPLLARARELGTPAVLITVPLHPTDLDQEFVGRLVEELRDGGDAPLVESFESEASFAGALRHLLRRGVLVVVDEFQRVLEPASGRPAEPLGDDLRRIAQRPADKGCLWLVSNREVDPAWTEPFYRTHLEAPAELQDQERIVLEAIDTTDREERFPAERRLEITRRLGANPRVLRLLGHLLRHYALEELLGPPGDVPEAPVEHQLTDGIERGLLSKAGEGLSEASLLLLRDLSVLRDPVQWELVEAMTTATGEARPLTRELRERYLLDVRTNRYQVHPVIREVEGPRLRDDGPAWRDAHRRAGRWYARLLHTADRNHVGDTQLALSLAGARYHLVEARATDELREAMRSVRSYIERRYGRAACHPSNDGERDAQISLLTLYLEEPGSAEVAFTLAKLLKERSAPGDLEKALPHAGYATSGQDLSDPWVLWIQLIREVDGLDAAVTAGRAATAQVAPGKNLYAVYQLLGASLDHLGRAEEAIDSLLEGAERSQGNAARLIEGALFVSAAERSGSVLQRVRDRTAMMKGFRPQLALAEVLLLEHEGAWRRGAEAAQRARTFHPRYLHLALHESICWLGAEEPQLAQAALDRFPFEWRQGPRMGNVWLASLVALHSGRLQRASELFATYVDANAPKTVAGIRAALLREWDHHVATVGEANPALTAPILPPAITGLDAEVRRPQYGSAVLPQHQSGSYQRGTRQDGRLHFLAVATEWDSRHGGLSTLNREFCRALAVGGMRVVCLVLELPPGETRMVDGVTLLGATRTPGQSEHDALSRKPTLPNDFSPGFIIGHGRVTGPAAQVLAEDHFPEAKRLHFIHMSPDEIEWLKLDRGDDTGTRAEERTQVELDLGRTAARAVTVGPTLHKRYLRDLSAYNDVAPPLRLDPGFDAPSSEERTPPPGEPWMVLLLGRLEDDRAKGLDLAARAVGLAAERRGASTPLEFVVRGAQPDTSDELQRKLRAWSGLPGLRVVVRPYTTSAERLEADLRRASLVLMPSRAEGFGLVGLEAIVVGTPALVSRESGLGALLCEALEPEQASRLVVRVSGNDEIDCEEWGRAVEATLRDREAAFRRAAEVRTQLGRQKTWAAAVAGLVAELDDGARR